MGLYPPWACAGRSGISTAIGYSWIFSPPQEACYAPVVDTSRLLIQWAIVAIVAAALFWVGLPPKRLVPIPTLAASCSQFPWVQVGEGIYQLNAPGMTVFVEMNHLGEYEAYRRVGNAAPEGLLKWDKPADAFSYADSMVPDEAVKLMLANARRRG